MNPMTFQGHKFDLRIWAICTSLDPLRVYLMGSGIPKVSQWKYVKDKSQVKNCQRGTLTTHRSPLTAHHSPLAAHRSPLTAALHPCTQALDGLL